MSTLKREQMPTSNEGLSYRIQPVVFDNKIKVFRASDFRYSKSAADTFKHEEDLMDLRNRGKLFHGVIEKKDGHFLIEPLFKNLPKSIALMMGDERFQKEIIVEIEELSLDYSLAELRKMSNDK